MFPRFWGVMFFPLNWTGELSRVAAVLLAVDLVALAYLAVRVTNRHKVLLGLGFATLCSIPAHQFLSIGPDLEKSRVIYFASVGMAILFAAIFEQLDWKVVLCAGALVAFQAAALENNLVHWRQIGELARRTCAAQAKLGRSVALGLPNIVDGVYFLHMGFPECVKFADPSAEASTVPHPGWPETVWDPDSRTLR
jgi:hypothetical protein